MQQSDLFFMKEGFNLVITDVSFVSLLDSHIMWIIESEKEFLWTYIIRRRNTSNAIAVTSH